MKKLICSSLILLAILAAAPCLHAGDAKIATVDLRKVFDNYYLTVQASIANSNDMVKVKKDLNEMYAARDKRVGEYQTAVANANDQATSTDERARYKKSAEDIALDIQIQNETITNFVIRTETKHRDDMIQHVHDLTADILRTLSAIAKKQGYTLVLDRTGESTTGNPIVLYTDGKDDLTDALLKELNSAAPANLNPGGSGTNAPPGTNSAGKPPPN